MADDVSTRERRSLMEAERTAAALPLSNDNVAVAEKIVNTVDVAVAGELNDATQLLPLSNGGHEQAPNTTFPAGGGLSTNIVAVALVVNKEHPSASNLPQSLKFPLTYKGKLLFFPKKCVIADENEELPLTARLQRHKQKLIDAHKPNKSLAHFEIETEPVKNEYFPFRRANFGVKFPVKYMENLESLWPKRQAAANPSKAALKKTPSNKFHCQSYSKLCETKNIGSKKPQIGQQIKPNDVCQAEFHAAEIFSELSSNQLEFAAKITAKYDSDPTDMSAANMYAAISMTTHNADAITPNNECCINSHSDICQTTQLMHKIATNYAISMAAADAKFPLMHHKHGYGNKFPLDSRLVMPQADTAPLRRATIVGPSTLPRVNLHIRQQCINNNSAVKKSFPPPSSHFPTLPNGAACTTFPLENAPPDTLTLSTATPPKLISNYKVENQNSAIFSAENNGDIAATMTQSEIFHINNATGHAREHTPPALEARTEISTNTQPAQRRTHNDGSNNDRRVLPKILAKNTQISRPQESGQSESSNFDGRSAAYLTDVHAERPHRPAITPPMCGAAAGARAPRARIRTETGINASDNGQTNFHNLGQPPTTLPAASSDVRDTSSQEVLLLAAAIVSAALETCTATENANATPNPALTPTSAQQPAAGPSNSTNLAFSADSVENSSVAAHEFDKSANAVIIANSNNNHTNNGENSNNHKNNSENNNSNNPNNSVSNATNINNSNNTNNSANDSANNINNGDKKNLTDVATPHNHLPDTEIIVRGAVEMTLTKVEDSEEDNLSVSSSIVDDNQKPSDIDQPADDMRIEMRSANKGASNLPSLSPRSSSSTPLHAHSHTYNLNHTATAPDTRIHSPGAVPHHVKPELGRYAKIEPRSVPTVVRTPPVTGAYERDGGIGVGVGVGVGVGSGASNVLLAASDVSMLSNFGKPRRTQNAVGRTPSADAVMDSSVLPTRTLLRRQRRMQSLQSEDKPEDALERLNRLKARISASLSEVKGVLQHYSVDEGDEGQASATARKTPTAGTLPKATATTASLIQPPSSEPVDLIKPAAAHKAAQSSTAAHDEVDKQMQSESPKNEGPVIFRFVKKVRRRSVFIEDDEEQPKAVEIKVDTKSAEEKFNGEQRSAVSRQQNREEFDQHEGDIKPHEASHKDVGKKVGQTEADRKESKQEFKEIGQQKDGQKETKFETAADHKTDYRQQQTDNKSSQKQHKVEESSTVKDQIVNEAFIKTETHKTTGQTSTPNELKASQAANEQQSPLSIAATAKSRNQEAPTTGTTKKWSSLTKTDDARRASIAAVEASKIEPPLKPEAAIDVKTQRRPSDSEAVLKKKAAAIKSLTSNKVETNNATNLQLPKMSVRLPNAAEVPIKPSSEVTNQMPSKPAVELATVKEEKSSDQSEESSTESKAKEAKDATKETEIEATAKPKRRLSLKTKTESTRRASIAAVEGTRIEPPVQTSTALDAKTQRRPSYSEAIVKRNAFAAAAQINNDTKPKVKIITKVKRPSVKSNASAIAPTTTTTAAANETTLFNETRAPRAANNSNKDAMSQIIKTATITTIAPSMPATAAFTKAAMTTTMHPTATAPTNNSVTPAPLPTQLAIDQPSTSQLDGRTVATKDPRLATKLDEQSGAMVATLVSPLRASDQSGQVSAATQLQQLVGETLIVTPTLGRKDETAGRQVQTRQSENSAAAERAGGAEVPVKTAPIAVIPKIPEALAATTTTDNNNSSSSSPQPPADIKKPIHQEEIPTDSVQVLTTSQQVSGANPERAPNAAVVADTSTRTGGDRTKASATPNSSISVDEHSAASTPATATTAATATDSAMPELQVVPAPVKAVQVFGETDATPPFNVPKDDYAPKKVTVKKFVRKNSIEKALSKQKSIEKAAEAHSQKKVASKSLTATAPASNDVEPQPAEMVAEKAVTVAGDEAPAVDESSAPAPLPKKARQVRKKVIIKRQQRKLSITDAFFKEPEPSEMELPAVETLEKPIEYVTDDDDDNDDAKNVKLAVEPVKPLKSCLKLREYQVGDWVLYGERFKKTQIRWKKGQIVERITSISYKIDIEGKEVSAHISYIKKYTSRKVKFSGKEYLEIDYEQIAEEEKRARNYSIWNMV